jgi:hypothetical protein
MEMAARLTLASTIKLTPYTLTRLIDRPLYRKEEKLVTTPQPNVILQILLGQSSKSITFSDLIDYIEGDESLKQEIEIQHSTETSLRFYIKKLEEAKFLIVE